MVDKVDTALVKMWGRLVGAVAWNDKRRLATFEFDPDFLDEGLDLAPLKMPWAAGAPFAGEIQFSRPSFRNLQRLARPAGRRAARQVRQQHHRRLAGPPGPHRRKLQPGRAALLHRPARHGRRSNSSRP